MTDVSYWGALFAGLLSFVSPCVLPIVPPYLAYLAGVSFSELSGEDVPPGTARRVFLSSLLFVLGFSTVFVALGLTANIIGQTIAQHFELLSTIAGIVIIIMGLHFLGLFRIGLLYREARFDVSTRPAGYIGAYIMGLAFAFGWTPCVGPVLAAILFVAGSEGSAFEGATLLGFYSLGIGVPFMLAALFVGPFLKWAAKFKQHMGKVEKAMGILLIVTGIAFVSGWMSLVSQKLIEWFPALTTIG